MTSHVGEVVAVVNVVDSIPAAEEENHLYGHEDEEKTEEEDHGVSLQDTQRQERHEDLQHARKQKTHVGSAQLRDFSYHKQWSQHQAHHLRERRTQEPEGHCNSVTVKHARDHHRK